MMRGLKSWFSVLFVIAFLLLLMLSTSPFKEAKAIAAATDGWQQQVSGTTASLHSVSAVDQNIAWAAGSSGTSDQGLLLKTIDGGVTWSIKLQDPNNAFSSVLALDANNVWVVGTKGTIMKTSNGGSTWTSQVSGTSNDLLKLSAVNSSIAWAVGAGGTILRTADGGNNWTSQSSGTTYSVNSVSAIDAQRAWAVASSLQWNSAGGNPWPPFANAPYYPVILFTSNGGATWEARDLGTYNEEFLDVSSPDGNTVIVGGNDIGYLPFPVVIPGAHGVYYQALVPLTSHPIEKNSGGDSGSFVPLPNPLNGSISAVDAPDPNTIWAVESLHFGQGVFKSSDGGNNWVEQTSLSAAYIWDLDAIDASTAWAVGSSGAIYKTSSGGDINPKPILTSVSPTEAGQFSGLFQINVQGAGFQEGATLSLQKGGNPIYVNISTFTHTMIIGYVFVFGAEPGAYDVVVTNPDGQEGRLVGAFNVTSACGSGSGSAVFMLGLSLGLISLAGSSKLARKRKRS